MQTLSYLAQLGDRLFSFLLASALCPVCNRGSPEPYLCSNCSKRLEIPPTITAACQRCGRPLSCNNQLCDSCSRGEPWLVEKNRCLAVYRGDWKELFHQYKSKQNRQLAYFLADKLASLYWQHYRGWEMVPIPPRPGKIKHQGWDQIALLSHLLQCRYQIPVSPLLRRLDRQKQKALNRQQRQSHQQRFQLLKDPSFERCLLFDDVLTTGTTLNRCALLLQQRGVKQVCSLTILVV